MVSVFSNIYFHTVSNLGNRWWKTRKLPWTHNKQVISNLAVIHPIYLNKQQSLRLLNSEIKYFNIYGCLILSHVCKNISICINQWTYILRSKVTFGRIFEGIGDKELCWTLVDIQVFHLDVYTDHSPVINKTKYNLYILLGKPSIN